MSTEPSPNRVTWGPTILLDITGQHERGGVDTSTIRDGVDYYQRVVLTNEELSAGISRLERADLIERRARGSSSRIRYYARRPGHLRDAYLSGEITGMVFWG